MRVAALLALSLVLTAACQRGGVPLPTTSTTVVASSADACRNAGALRSSLDAWATAATRDLGSVAYVVVAGRRRDEAATTFAAVVPDAWRGGDVLAAKRAWLESHRSSTRQAEGRKFLSTVPWFEYSPIIENVRVIPSTNSAGDAWTFTPGTVTHTAIVCDVSASADAACDAASLGYAYERWMKTGIEPSSTFEIWRVGTSLSTARRVFAIRTRADSTLGDRIAYLLGGRNELDAPALLTTKSAEAGSAVAEAIAVAVRSLHDRRGAHALWVLSDMRQLTPREIDVEQGTMPGQKRFNEWLTANGLIVDLSDVDIGVCGLHNRVRPDAAPMPPRRFSELRDLWLTAFRSMRARTITICGACDAAAFNERRSAMAKTAGGMNVLEVGAHRGAHALIRAVPEDLGRMIGAWGLVDTKPGRAEEAAAFAHERFPWVRLVGATGDGVAAATAAKQATVIATMDSVGSTIDVIEQRERHRSLFQLVGRGPGGSATGNRIGVAGLVGDDASRSESLLLLRGLQSLTERASMSSGALTRGGDPLTAAMLAPMRDAASLQTARYLMRVARGSASDAPLTYFSTSEQYPLAVIRDADETDSARSALALHTASRFPVPRNGHSVAVGFVNIADRAIRIFFVSRSTQDARRVTGITELRVPARRIVAEAVFTD